MNSLMKSSIGHLIPSGVISLMLLTLSLPLISLKMLRVLCIIFMTQSKMRHIHNPYGSSHAAFGKGRP